MNKNIKLNIFLNTFGSIFYCICQWSLTIVVVKIASYELAGYLSLAMTTSSSFSAIALFSMRNYQISDVKEQYSSNVYLGSRIFTSVIAFICCLISAIFTYTGYQVLCILAFMVIRLTEAIVDVLHGINQKYNHYEYIGISYIFRGIITAALFPALLMVSGNLPFTLAVIAGMNIMATGIFDWRKTYSIDHFRITLWNKKIWKLLKECAPIALFSFLLSLENLIPKSILQAEFGTEMLGIYSSVSSPVLVVQVFASVAFTPLLPVISQAIHNGEKKQFKSMIHKTYFVFIGMGIIILLGASIFGKLGLKILFGESILPYYSILMPIVLSVLLTGMVWVLSSVVIALRKTNILLIGMIFNFIFCIILSLNLIKQMGMNGVSLVQIIMLAIYIMFLVIICETIKLN